MPNTTFDCASLHQFSDFFAINTTNVTTAVEACPEKCSLAWGKGNPDLSGIGVFVSYILQLAVCLLLGPCYAIVYRFLDRKRQKHLAEIHITALQTTVFLACPIAVASIIDLKRRPTLFEARFVYYLNIMELLAACVLVSTMVLRREGDEAFPIETRETITLVLGLTIQLGLSIGVIHWVDRRSLSAKEVRAFVTACERSGVVVPIPPRDWANKYNKSLKGFLGVLLLISIGAAVGIYLLIAKSKSKSRPVWLCLVSTGLATGVAYSFAKMHLARVELARLSKNDYADNEWGFGQIVALFAWVPLLVEASIPLLIAGSGPLTPVWTRAKEAVKSKVQKPNDEVEPEQ
ncbi:hypothetical protein NW752_003263 [Fusarium irregulare]|uniref:Uncharacterized protein n=1 Tax=Fusarium irregulare TaxID=2494466 RepID=A0A9W8UGQ0_9HYPO|nr:hypothetical protein NW766_000953 [Fusarium irregulare]KAJ4025787.1 hypothetical protein NW752_003263 [Fusarium irregulare]